MYSLSLLFLFYCLSICFERSFNGILSFLNLVQRSLRPCTHVISHFDISNTTVRGFMHNIRGDSGCIRRNENPHQIFLGTNRILVTGT
jgi:hypothetical protein